jgi:hypothetical protein
MFCGVALWGIVIQYRYGQKRVSSGSPDCTFPEQASVSDVCRKCVVGFYKVYYG